jgi:hypothetical protein
MTLARLFLNVTGFGETSNLCAKCGSILMAQGHVRGGVLFAP